MKTQSKLMLLELIGGLFGWAWIVAALAGLYFLVMAIGFGGSWSRFLWSLGAAAVSKWLAKGFRDSQRRVEFEAKLIEKGYSPEEAGREWIKQYTGGKG